MENSNKISVKFLKFTKLFKNEGVCIGFDVDCDFW